MSIRRLGARLAARLCPRAFSGLFAAIAFSLAAPAQAATYRCDVNGTAYTSAIRQEIVTLRGIVPGEYVVNAHYYDSADQQPVDVTVTVVKVNPQAEIVFNSTQQLPAKGDERTLVRFTLNDAGQVIDLNTRPQTIVQRAGL